MPTPAVERLWVRKPPEFGRGSASFSTLSFSSFMTPWISSCVPRTIPPQQSSRKIGWCGARIETSNRGFSLPSSSRNRWLPGSWFIFLNKKKEEKNANKRECLLLFVSSIFCKSFRKYIC